MTTPVTNKPSNYSAVEYKNQFFTYLKNAVDSYSIGEDNTFWANSAYDIAVITANHAENYPTPYNMQLVDVMAEMLTMLYTLQAYQPTKDKLTRFIRQANSGYKSLMFYFELKIDDKIMFEC